MSLMLLCNEALFPKGQIVEIWILEKHPLWRVSFVGREPMAGLMSVPQFQLGRADLVVDHGIRDLCEECCVARFCRLV